MVVYYQTHTSTTLKSTLMCKYTPPAPHNTAGDHLRRSSANHNHGRTRRARRGECCSHCVSNLVGWWCGLTNVQRKRTAASTLNIPLICRAPLSWNRTSHRTSSCRLYVLRAHIQLIQLVPSACLRSREITTPLVFDVHVCCSSSGRMLHTCRMYTEQVSRSQLCSMGGCSCVAVGIASGTR